MPYSLDMYSFFWLPNNTSFSTKEKQKQKQNHIINIVFSCWKEFCPRANGK